MRGCQALASPCLIWDLPSVPLGRSRRMVLFFQAYTIGKKSGIKKKEGEEVKKSPFPPSTKAMEKQPRKAEESAKCLAPWQAGREWAAL